MQRECGNMFATLPNITRVIVFANNTKQGVTLADQTFPLLSNSSGGTALTRHLGSDFIWSNYGSIDDAPRHQCV